MGANRRSLLYYTTTILTHRPFWSVPAYYQTCINAARSIERLVLLLESTFGLDNITYLMGYCIYTGASAILEDAKKGAGIEDPILKTYLRALNCGKKRCPLLERSLNIIIKSVGHVPVHLTVPDREGQIDFAAPNTYIPAFPYLDPTWSANFGIDSNHTGIDMDPMAMLDCYPELQMDLGDMAVP